MLQDAHLMPTLAPLLKAHGAEIPAIGFGTSGLGYVTTEHVAAALKAGYRHIDTARKYGTEPAVGEAMRACGIPRCDIFVCTKVSHENLHAGDFARSVDEEEVKADIRTHCLILSCSAEIRARLDVHIIR